MVLQAIFLVVAAVTLVSALFVVGSRALVHSALWLVAALFGVGVMYVILEAGFFALAQVLIYIGAIAILFIFAVMLTRRIMQDTGPQHNSNWWLAVLVAAVLFAGLFVIIRQAPGFNVQLPALANEQSNMSDLGRALVSSDGYLLPFELASVLLVAAMVGAIYSAWAKK